MLQLCDRGIDFVDRSCKQSVQKESTGRARNELTWQATWYVGHAQNTRESERQVRGGVELLGTSERCEQRVRVTNRSLFGHGEGGKCQHLTVLMLNVERCFLNTCRAKLTMKHSYVLTPCYAGVCPSLS
jgi:hypothetical protein